MKTTSLPTHFLLLAALLLTALPIEAKPKISRAERKAAEQSFLSENSNKPGITTTKSGLQYEILQTGEGAAHPKFRQSLSIHYHGTFADGTVFQSTLNQKAPLTLRFENVIAGWREGLKLMKAGDKFRFYIPSALGYGSYSEGDIPAYSVLIFEIELFAIE